MKRFILIIAGILSLTQLVHAVDRSRNAGAVSPFTGDQTEFQQVSVSSTTAATLGAYSTSRGALTCINSDSSNAVYIGSSTAITAAGAATMPLFPRSSIQILNNAGLFAIADTGVASVTVYCLKEY